MKKTEKSAILLIYTGGTIGMKENGHGLVPFDFSQILDEVPELQKFTFKIDCTAPTPWHIRLRP